MKTILIIASFKESLVNFRGDLITGMVERGHVVHVAAPGLDTIDELQNILIVKGAIVHRLSMDRNRINPIADIRAFFDLWTTVRNVRPDIVFAYTIKPVIYGLIASRLCKIGDRVSLITGLGGVLGGKSVWLRKVLVCLHKFAMSGQKVVFFQNASDKEFFETAGILKNVLKTMIVDGSGVNLDSFGQSVALAHPVTFFMAARLLRAKGVYEFAESAEMVLEQGSRVRFLLAGWNEDGPDFVDNGDLELWQAKGVLTYLGHLRDVRPSLRESSVFVLPSYYPEGVPRSILEAMATGRPIITTDMPGCRETVVEGVNGFLVPPRDPKALAAAMQRFIDEPSLIPKMGAESRRIAEEKYDVHKVNKVILDAMGL